MTESSKSVVSVVSVAEKILRRESLAETEAVECVQCLAQQVALLHAAGRIHRAIGLAAIEFQGNDRIVLSPPPSPLAFGGTNVDIDTCPPELQNQPTITLAESIEDARQELADYNIPMAPQRVDVYQLGALFCRLLTGTGVDSYLHSAKIKCLIPTKLQAAIDLSLGYDPSRRHQTVDEFMRAFVQNTLAERDTDSQSTGIDRDTGSARPALKRALATSEDQNNAAARDADIPFRRLGHYEILERIGHGGMGDVYKGYERALDRVVAIKVLPAEFARQEEFVARFRAEAAAVAALTHPNVIHIYFIGEDDGHHFFVMQYVDGETLGQRIQRHGRLDIVESVSILEQVLAGLSAAHERGIIHRDIKPANVLLDRVHRRALVADFGLVKSVGGQTKMTATGVVMGTVDYISPEQGRGLAVDARSDLYSVGVLAYQLLSGRLPFEADSPTALIFQHVYEQPKPLRSIVANLPSSLCAVVEKLLAKSPDDRYQSAEEVLAAFSKFRSDNAQPASQVGSQTAIIQAPRDGILLLPEEFEQTAGLGWWHRTRQQWLDRLRRHQPAFIKQLQNTQQQVDGALAEYDHRRKNLVQLVREAESVLEGLRRSDSEYREAAKSASRRAADATDVEEQKEARHEETECLRAADALAAPIAEQQGQLETMQLKLAHASATLDKLRNQRDLLNARLKVAQARTALAEKQPTRPVIQVATRLAGFVGLGAALVVATIHFWPNPPPPNASTAKAVIDWSSGAAGEIIVPVAGEVQSIALSPSRMKTTAFPFATGNADGSINLFRGISPSSYNDPARLSAHIQPIKSMVYAPDGKRFAAASEDGAITVWDSHSNQQSRALRRIENPGAPASQVLFSPDSSQLLSGSHNGSLRLWDVAREQEIHHLNLDLRWIQALDWSQDGRHVLIGLRLHGGDSMELVNLYDASETVVFDTSKKATEAVSFSRWEDQAISLRDQSIYVNDIRTKEVLRHFGSGIKAAAFSPYTHRIWTADEAHNLSLWDLRSGSAVESYSGHTDKITAVAISGDGSQAFSASRDGTIRIWDLPGVPPPANQMKELACGGPILTIACSPDGYSALTSSVDDLTLWEIDSGTVLRKFNIKHQIPAAVFAADGQSIIYGSGRPDSKLGLVGIRSVAERSLVDKRQFEGHDGLVTSVALSRDMRRAVSGGNDGTVRVWDVESGGELKQLKLGEPVNSVEISNDGDLVLIGANGNNARIWKWNTSTEVTQLEGHSFRVLDLSISRDGTRFATASGDRTVRVWDLATGRLLAKLTGHAGPVNAVALSEHGLIALTGSSDSTVRLWDVASAKETQRFEGHVGEVRSVALSPSGTRALSGGDDGILRVWQLPVTIQ